MKRVRQYVRTSTGILLRASYITILSGSGPSLAPLYAVDGTPIPNPVTSSDDGVVEFYVQDTIPAISYTKAGGLSSFPPIPLPIGVNEVYSSSQANFLPGVVSSTVFLGQAVEGDPYGKISPCVSSGDCLGVATQSGIPGQPVIVVTQGVFEHHGYSFTPEEDIYVGLNGFLTQTIPQKPSMTFSQKVGVAITSTKIMVNVEPPIDLI